MKNQKVIFLIGFMGSGKTTLGKKLATIKKTEFSDLDSIIEKKLSKSIAQIFDEREEPGFRIIESEILKTLETNKPKVISVGGGTPCFFDNMDWMKKNGLVVYLKCSSGFLYSRLIQSERKRPLLKDVQMESLLDFIQTKLLEREQYYMQADVIIEADAINVFDLVNSISLSEN